MHTLCPRQNVSFLQIFDAHVTCVFSIRMKIFGPVDSLTHHGSIASLRWGRRCNTPPLGHHPPPRWQGRGTPKPCRCHEVHASEMSMVGSLEPAVQQQGTGTMYVWGAARRRPRLGGRRASGAGSRPSPPPPPLSPAVWPEVLQTEPGPDLPQQLRFERPRLRPQDDEVLLEALGVGLTRRCAPMPS